MENESDNGISEIKDTDSAVGAPDVACAAESSGKRGNKRLPLIKSIFLRTAIDYFLFSLIILILFFGVFIGCLYVFYGSMIERETRQIVLSASSGFPKRVNDNSLLLYKYRLVDVARNNKPVAIAVFQIDDDANLNLCIAVDDMGNGFSENNDLFDAVAEDLNFECVFVDNGMCKVGTPFGTYLCAGNVHNTEDGSAAYLLVMKPYEIWNNQTVRIVYVLMVCTGIVMLLTGAFAFFASRHQTKQLTDFSQKAKRLAEGDYNVQFSGYGYNEYEYLANALNTATTNMQNAEKLQRDIVANVSHDMRTPLTMIRAYAEMLRDMPMSAEKREKTANVIIAESDRLTALVSDVLNYSKLQSGVTEYKFESCDISSVASSVLEQFAPVCERDGIVLARDIDEGATVTCDRPKIEQVLYNLLSNAINYCGDDKTVILRVKKQDDRVRVEVTDHGSGIAPEEIDSVWDRYYRSARSQRAAVGTGLGLSICKSVLTAHDAEFGVISEVGKGSTFWFELSTKN